MATRLFFCRRVGVHSRQKEPKTKHARMRWTVDCIVSNYSGNVLRPNGTTIPLLALTSVYCSSGVMEQALRLLPFLFLRVLYEIPQTLILPVVALDMSHAQVTCLEPLQMRLAHGSCQSKHRQTKRLQYLVHHAQDEGGQDPQRLLHRSKRDSRWKKTVRQRYIRHMVWFGLWVRRTPLEIRIGAVVATISLDFRNHSACVRLFVCLSVRGDGSRQRAPNGNTRACRAPHRTVRLNVQNNSPRHRFQRRG